ncbi:MAG: redoxin family protein [Flavobacteriaceae bacterium]|nr:redoxin family protein [Flavobacteriaceae bacterium]
MIKTNLNIAMIITVFFISLNLISQSRIQAVTISYNAKTSHWLNSKDNNIQVISILGTKNIAELKKLDQFAEKYGSKNVSFIAITDKQNDSLNNLIKDEIKNYQYLSKNDNLKVFNTYQTGMFKVFPIHVIINNEGKIIYKKKGNSNNIENKLAKRIDKLLDQYGKETNSVELQYTVR